MPTVTTATDPGSWAVLMPATACTAFGDGVLIASAFMADLHLGLAAALAVLVHEVPHHIGDLAVLAVSSHGDRRAWRWSRSHWPARSPRWAAWSATCCWTSCTHWVPYLLVLAASSFVYVALADLIPQLQRRLSTGETAAQILWLAVGIGLVLLVSGLAHSH
jgi:zinc and cadmium transporter